jgi:1-acyl-sn-glycerol-3-phosphate acyltransferase
MILSALKVSIIAIVSAVAGTLVAAAALLTRSDRLFFTLVKTWAHLVLGVAGVRVTVEGAERVDFSRSYIIVANHASLFDIPSVIVGIPADIRIVYRKDLGKIPFFGWGLRIQNVYIPIDRENRQDALQTIGETQARIARGGCVLMFGEGTRTPDGSLQQFKRGPFNLASKAGVPVVPLAINGSFGVLQKGSLRIRPGTITLVLDRPIGPSGTDGKQAELLLRDQVRAAIERNLKEE